jgi:hypothetical protein
MFASVGGQRVGTAVAGEAAWRPDSVVEELLILQGRAGHLCSLRNRALTSRGKPGWHPAPAARWVGFEVTIVRSGLGVISVADSGDF